MTDRPNPGPPLTVEKEFCACEAPSAVEYLKAGAACLIAGLAGAVAWLGLVLLLQRISGIAAVLIALGAGWAVHRAAGRHRSLALGLLAAASSLLASLGGFGLLWLPAFARLPLPRQLDWYQLSMIGLGALVAFSLAGPRGRSGKSL
ncbi:MAG: hypothetical protein ACOY93_12605 [Bacillota bacterium]